MSISRVKRGDVLTAAKINELVDNANTQQGGRVEQEPILTAEVSMKNIGQTKIYAGNPIVVTGSRVTGTLATRLNRFRKFGFQLSGRTNTITKTSSLAVAVEDISPGAIGRAVIPGLFAAYVYYKNNTDMQTKYCDVDNSGNFVYNQTEGEGAFEIVAPNGYETLAAGGSYYARDFAYIRSRGGGGGGSSLKAYVDAIQWNVDVNKIVPGAYISFTNSDGEITIKGRYGVNITSGGKTVNITSLIAGSNIAFSNNGSALTITGPESTTFVDSYSPATTTSARTLYLGKPFKILNESQPGGSTISRINLYMTNRYYVTDVTCNTGGDLVVTKEMLYSE